MTAAQMERLRADITTATRHGTGLIADLNTVAERLAALVPELAECTGPERWPAVARFCNLDETMPDRLATLVESLADVLAGLTPSDGGDAWLEHRRAALAAGDEDDEAA